MLLAGGGIGVTPVVGMLKDIYNINLAADVTVRSHSIESIYFMWCMPKLEDYECFRTEVEQCIELARAPGMPDLVPLIYITRSKEKLAAPFISGRPNILDIYKKMMKNRRQCSTALVFGCGPQPLIAELWDKSIQYTVRGDKVDFHHEIFEF
jgi:NAD(P)H-flavin reductase